MMLSKTTEVASTQTRIIAIPSLSELVNDFTAVLADPAGHGVAHTEAQISVLGHVRAAFLNQRQIPITPGTSAERGAHVALQHAAARVALLEVTMDGDCQPDDSDRLVAGQDDQGRLNPMRLFEEGDLSFGLYPFSALSLAVRDGLGEERMQLASGEGTIALVSVEDIDDWETWMDTFAR